MNLNPHDDGRVVHAGAPLKEAALAMVLLHGRGGSADDMLGLAAAFDVPGVAYLIPEAQDCIWYPQSFLVPREANEPYLSSALRTVGEIVRVIEQTGIPRQRVVIGGFSQGACLAAEFVATQPARYGGMIGFTGGLMGPPGSVAQRADPAAGAELGGMPVLLSSGDPDPHVPWARVEESATVLKAMGAEVTTKRYPGRPHTIVPEEVALARALLRTAKTAGASATVK